MQLGYIILFVEDVAETLAFYNDAFDVEFKFLHESKLYGEADTGAVTLAFASYAMAAYNDLEIRRNRPDELPAGAQVSFVTEDVAAAYKNAVEGGAVGAKAPEQKPWGQTVAYVRDLNGFLVEICSPVARSQIAAGRGDQNADATFL